MNLKEIIYKSKKNVRLDSFLRQDYPLFSTGVFNKLLRQNKIKVNDAKPAATAKLQCGDKISLYIEDSYFEKPTKDTAFQFSGRFLDIVYEDINILIVNKPAGIPVVDDAWENFDTLTNRVINHYFLLDKQFSFTPCPCHRIDTGTQGLVIFAKSSEALDFITLLFKNKQVKKSYLCVVKGVPKSKNSIEKAYLTKKPKEGYVTISQAKNGEASKAIETHLHLLESLDGCSLLEVGLITGKTHQIRAHLAFLNLPILGDSRYGDNGLNRKLKLKYQLLCSYSIKFGTILQEDFKCLHNREFTCPKPWFVDSFHKNEFSIK